MTVRTKINLFNEFQVQDIQDIIHNVKTRMGKARQLQDMLRSYEARDRNLAEMNCARVTFLSLLTIVSMICVGFLQVFMIRSLFGTDAKEKRVWEKINKIVENFK
jgi:p24 family protein gamma-2